MDDLIRDVYSSGYPSKGKMLSILRMQHRIKIDKSVRELVNNFYNNMFHDIYKPVPKVKRFSRFTERVVDRTHQMDLMKLPKDKKTGATYVLCVIDVASRKAAAWPLRGTSAYLAKEAMLTIYNEKRYMRVPQRIQTDGGSEFKGVFNARLKESNVAHITTIPENKNHQAIVERFNLTLAKRIFRHMIAKESDLAGDNPDFQYNNWVHILESVVESYNNTYHTGIDATPNDVYDGLAWIQEPKLELLIEDELPVGTNVRIPAKSISQKHRATDPNWSSQAYMIGSSHKKNADEPIK